MCVQEVADETGQTHVPLTGETDIVGSQQSLIVIDDEVAQRHQDKGCD